MYHDGFNINWSALPLNRASGLFPLISNMPKKPDFTFEVRIRISEAFTLDSIVRRPRTFKPKDVLSACQNNEVVCKQDNPPPSVESLATYVMTDFFALAHATGLYNRQTQLWEALSKVTAIHVVQQQTGLFQKSALPVYDFAFVDYKGKTLLYALLVDGQAAKMKPSLTILKSFIGRAKNKWGCQGVLAAFSKPMPPDVLSFIQHATATPDPIARYESIFPALKIPFDLLEMDKSKLGRTDEPSESDNPDEPDEPITIFRLLHPDLRKKDSLEPPVRPRPAKKKKVEVDETTADEPREADATPSSSKPTPASLLSAGLDPDDILDRLDREAAATSDSAHHETEAGSIDHEPVVVENEVRAPEPVSVSATQTSVDDAPSEASSPEPEKRPKKSAAKKGSSAGKGTRSTKPKSAASSSSSNSSEAVSSHENSAQIDPPESHGQSVQEPSQPNSESSEN
jgi:hypothetical protein